MKVVSVFFGCVFFAGMLRAQVVDLEKIKEIKPEKGFYEVFVYCKEDKGNFTGTDTVHLMYDVGGEVYYSDTITIYEDGKMLKVESDSLVWETVPEKIMAVREYVNGKKVKATGYFDNGNKFIEANFNGRNRHGMMMQWYKGGQRSCQIFFDEGKIISSGISWYPDGSLESYADPVDNMDKARTMQFFPDGKLMKTSTPIENTERGVIQKSFYKNGKLKCNIIGSNGKQLMTFYYENGVKSMEGYIIEAPFYQVGKWQEWYRNGQLKEEINYIDQDTLVNPNVLHGINKYWDSKGNLIKEEYYENNKLIKAKEYTPMNKKLK